MDKAGVDVQAVSIAQFGIWDWADRDLAGKIIRLQNEKMAEFCAGHPDRFVGLASVAMEHPDEAPKQLEEAVKKLGLRGCCITAEIKDDELSDPKFHSFWAKAEELQAFVLIHPQGFREGARRFRGNGGLGNVIGSPVATSVALSHLIQEGTLDRFPGLKICAAHGGGYLPNYAGRSDLCLSVFPEQCKPLKKMPSEYLKQLYYDSILFTGEGLRHLVATVGASQVLMGTDYSAPWNPNPVDHILMTPSLSNADRIAVLGGNAAKLLRIGK
jgi:aminocarboxymuconate-semialdehyde decarboxylase